jgi:hypothetical protein
MGIVRVAIFLSFEQHTIVVAHMYTQDLILLEYSVLHYEILGVYCTLGMLQPIASILP